MLTHPPEIGKVRSNDIVSLLLVSRRVSISSKVKNVLRLAMPSIYETLQGFSTRQRTKYVTKSLTSEIGWAVQSGPFEGMRYVPKAVGSTLVPKLLGCYESELHHTLNVILERNYQKIIDIGCAE